MKGVWVSGTWKEKGGKTIKNMIGEWWDVHNKVRHPGGAVYPLDLNVIQV